MKIQRSMRLRMEVLAFIAASWYRGPKHITPPIQSNHSLIPIHLTM